MKKLFYILLILLGFVGYSFGAVQTYYVTPTGNASDPDCSGGGAPTCAGAWDLSDVENLSNWSAGEDADKIDPGDTVYFTGDLTGSGNFDFPSDLGGTLGNNITFDGDSDGTCDPWNDSCAGGSDVASFELDGNDYITIQDFHFNSARVQIAKDNLSTGIIVRNNYFSGEKNVAIGFDYQNDSTAFNNKIKMTGPNYGSLLSLRGGHNNKIIHNYCEGDSSETATGIYVASELDAKGFSCIIKDNIIAGNTVINIWQEAISFDNSPSTTKTFDFEEDTVSSSSTNTVTLSDAGWGGAGNDMNNGAYMFFATGSLAG